MGNNNINSLKLRTCKLCEIIMLPREEGKFCEMCKDWEKRMKPNCNKCDKPIPQTLSQRKMYGNWCSECNSKCKGKLSSDTPEGMDYLDYLLK